LGGNKATAQQMVKAARLTCQQDDVPPDAVNLLLMAGDCCENCPIANIRRFAQAVNETQTPTCSPIASLGSLRHTLTEFARQADPINHAGNLLLPIAADEGCGNVLNVKRSREGLDWAAATGHIAPSVDIASATSPLAPMV
jgi:hypothetical protein